MDADAAEPRRGGRERKAVERFEPTMAATGRKRMLNDEQVDDEDEEDDADADSSEEEAPVASSSKKKRGANATQKRTQAEAGTSKEKAKKPRKKAAVANGATGGASGEGEGVKDDSPLFNALLNAEIALNTIVEDWVESYQGAAGDEAGEKEAVQQLILFVLRCCGLTADVDEDEAMDVDGIADTVERIEEESAKTTAALYPLINRTTTLKPFRSNLNLFISQLIKTLSQTPLLYHTSDNTTHSTPLLPLLQSWLHNLSTSALRPLRHTATYISIKINTALCDVSSDVSKDLSLKQRQREAEAKKGSGGGAAGHKKVKEAEKKVKEAHEMKVTLESLMQETVDVVFVHRVRDSDAAIRTDCLKELGAWVKAYPEKFVDRQYLNYFSRGCNDPDAHARTETVKALSALYTKDSFVNNARTVTLRLAPRLIEMALRDVDISVRVRALEVIALIDKTGILQDEDTNDREQVARLVFDPEPRIRKAIGGFFRGLWEERTEALESAWKATVGNKKKRGKNIAEEDMTKYLGWKALAALLMETNRAIDRPLPNLSQSQSQSQTQAGSSSIAKDKDSVSPSVAMLISRAEAAVEALSGGIAQLQEWDGLVDYLLLDHSTNGDDIWLLDEEEEGLMTHVLVACVKADAEDLEETEDSTTKTLMDHLPRLLAKNHSDVGRMTGVLSLPGLMKLELYLDMRKSAAYDSLWDDISKQFLTHSDPALLTAAIGAINTLTTNTSLSANNNTKLTELQETLLNSLRDALNGEEVPDLSLGDEEAAELEAIMLRLSLLERSRDLVEVMEDTEGGQSSGWDIVCEFVQRGAVGFKEEAKIVEYAMQVVFLHLTWLFKRFTPEDARDSAKVEALVDKRKRVIEVLQVLALSERSNAAETVRRQAFVCYINTFVLFSAKSPAPAAQAAPLVMEDEVQHRLGGSFQAAVERYAAELEETRPSRGTDDEEGPDTAIATSDDPSRSRQTAEFLQLVSVFVASIRTGVLEVDHAKEPLAHYGRFGSTYDAVVRRLVDVLRDEGIYNREAVTVQNVAGSALQASFNIFLDSDDPEPAATLSLAKLISTAFVIHGTHFTILKQLHPSDAADFHLSSIDYLARRITSYVNQERANKSKDIKTRLATKRGRALSGWFRVLLPLLGPVNGRDALRIKAHMEEQMGGTGAPFLVGKNWEAYRIYEKRLVSIAARDQGVKDASKRVVQDGKGAAAASAKAKSKKQGAEEDKDRARTDTLSPNPEEGERESTPTPRSTSASGRGLQRSKTDTSAELKRGRKASHPPEEEEAEEVEEEEQAGDDEDEAEAEAAEEAPEVDLDAEVNIDDLMAELDGDLDLDLDFDVASRASGTPRPGSSQRGRMRSESVGAGAVNDKAAKRRKIGRPI